MNAARREPSAGIVPKQHQTQPPPKHHLALTPLLSLNFVYILHSYYVVLHFIPIIVNFNNFFFSLIFIFYFLTSLGGGLALLHFIFLWDLLWVGNISRGTTEFIEIGYFF